MRTAACLSLFCGRLPALLTLSHFWLTWRLLFSIRAWLVVPAVVCFTFVYAKTARKLLQWPFASPSSLLWLVPFRDLARLGCFGIFRQ